MLGDLSTGELRNLVDVNPRIAESWPQTCCTCSGSSLAGLSSVVRVAIQNLSGDASKAISLMENWLTRVNEFHGDVTPIETTAYLSQLG
jgi:hypothetical protein